MAIIAACRLATSRFVGDCAVSGTINEVADYGRRVRVPDTISSAYLQVEFRPCRAALEND